MNHAIRSAAILILAVAGAISAQNPPDSRRAPRLVNPASPAARLMLAAPEERQRYLEKLPPERRERIQKQLEWFDSLPREQQQLQIRRAERFAGLSPERRLVTRQRMLDFNQLPPQRKQAIRRALVLLQDMNPRQRANRLNSPAFKMRFSEEERRILESLSENLLPPR
jgi:hypothetical protein